MKLFVSYARVDKPFCTRIVNTLDVHETWFDQRLSAGQNWWAEILRRLEWCEGFIYLLSPESVESEYCKKEFDLAQQFGRHIFPVLIQPDTELPESLREMHYVDLSKGLTSESAKELWNAIYRVQHGPQPADSPPPTPQRVPSLTAEHLKPPSPDPFSAINAATQAMAKGQFDNAVFLLKRAKASGHHPRFINLDAVLEEAEASLRRQSYLREAKREYDQIHGLVKLDRMRKLGCEAFQAFQKIYPDYDPENLAALCGQLSTEPTALVVVKDNEPKLIDFKLPMLEWCEIPDGNAYLGSGSQNGHSKDKDQLVVEVGAFKISRYPITNAQYRVFLDDPIGYNNARWWQFSPEAQEWRDRNPEAQPPTYRGDERPRERVNWYDANAFCAWLSMRLGVPVTLPTDAQWIRAARGDEKRIFPWGDIYDKQNCNTRESEIKMTTMVTRYDTGVSLFGVYDMSGNVWEWCQDLNSEAGSNGDTAAASKRLVHGGAFISPCQRAEIGFHYYLDPHSFHSTIGFRVIIGSTPAVQPAAT